MNAPAVSATRSDVAIHEAGHAVMAAHFRIYACKIALFRDGETWTGTTKYPSGIEAYPGVAAMIALAGSRAEHIWLGLDEDLVSDTDWEEVMKTGVLGMASRRDLLDESKSVLLALEPFVLELSGKLRSCETLGGEALSQILTRVKPSIFKTRG